MSRYTGWGVLGRCGQPKVMRVALLAYSPPSRVLINCNGRCCGNIFKSGKRRLIPLAHTFNLPCTCGGDIYLKRFGWRRRRTERCALVAEGCFASCFLLAPAASLPRRCCFGLTQSRVHSHAADQVPHLSEHAAFSISTCRANIRAHRCGCR